MTDIPITQCPMCHVPVRPSDYFCYNCGKNLHPAPPPTNAEEQIKLYLGSILLPPMGIIWGVRYLRQKDDKSKIVGLIAIVITIVVLVLAVKATMDVINGVNTQMNQIQNLQGF